MKSSFLVAASCLLLVAVSAGVPQSGSLEAATPLGVVVGPSNVAMIYGPSVTLQCRVQVTTTERVQWTEFGTNPNGELISDKNVILPGHPNANRYALLVNMTTGVYDLYIYPTEIPDGTYYTCSDINSAPPATVIRGAQLVMILAAPNCSSTLPVNGIVLENEYYTAECVMYFKASLGVEPLMTWTGPTPFNTVYTVSNTSVFAGIGFTVQRHMDAKMYNCKTNFTQKGFIAPDSASNIPTYTSEYRTQQLFVHWPPKNMYASPSYPTYEVGTVITCFADAFPMATLYWQSLKTGQKWDSQSFTITEDMVGNQTMRCHAENYINNIQYYNDHYIPLLVNPVKTTPAPGISTTTTAPPAEADCLELTGRWEATNPKAMMCIWIDLDNNGVLSGLFKNGTDTYTVDIYGRAQVNTWDQGGFSAVWPSTIGVTGHVFECRRCLGTEILTLNQIQRSDAWITTCGDAGPTIDLPQFTFYRVVSSPPCSLPASF